jgi:hypothetical protein
VMTNSDEFDVELIRRFRLRVYDIGTLHGKVWFSCINICICHEDLS